VRVLVFALGAAAAGQQQGRQFARQAALHGRCVAVLEPAAYGGLKDASAAWAAGMLAVDAGPVAEDERPEDLQELWAERAAIMA